MYLACDIGGTKGTVAAYATLHSMKPLRVAQFAMTKTAGRQVGDFGQDFDNLLTSCLTAIRKHGNVEGVGLAVAGKVDAARSMLTTAGNLGHWSGEPVAALLGDQLRTRVVLGNDAEALALADAVYGHGQSNEFRGVDFMGMIWGTGVGGCCVRYRDGQFLTIPAEPGHLCVKANSLYQCGCGQCGCLEVYAGGSGLQNYFKPAEDLAREEWLDVADWMAIGLRSILAVQPVKLVVFSGGIACKQSWLLEHIESRLTHPMSGSPKLRLSAFGESAGTLGALSLLSL